MLIKLTEWLQKANNLKVPHKGTVLDNIDSKKLGRVKVQIEELLEGSSSELPWVYPNNPFGLGGKSDSSGFSVPEIGSELTIIFPYDDIYFPFYTGYWQSELNHQSVFDEDYPETYGFRDSSGNILQVNKTQKYMQITHSSGTVLKVDIVGNITITNPGDTTITTTGDMDWIVGGDMSIQVTGNLDIDAAQIDLN